VTGRQQGRRKPRSSASGKHREKVVNSGNPRWQFVLAGIAIMSAIVYLVAWLIFGLLKL
jgi:hypothetical protein